MKLSQTRIAIVLAILVATSSGCGVIYRIRAKNQLNEAARAYREGHFDVAEQHARNAYELDPTNKTAPMFIARTRVVVIGSGVRLPMGLTASPTHSTRPCTSAKSMTTSNGPEGLGNPTWLVPRGRALLRRAISFLIRQYFP